MLSVPQHVSETLGIPLSYIRQSIRENRVEVAVHKTWLRSLLQNSAVPEFVAHETFGEDEVLSWMQQGEELGVEWCRLHLRIITKHKKDVIPLPRLRSAAYASDQSTDTSLSYGELLHYISQTNHRNTWKEVYKRHCPDRNLLRESCDEPLINLIGCDQALRDVIVRTYCCPIINLTNQEIEFGAWSRRNLRELEPHCNILPAMAAIETDHTFILLLQPFISHTLQDCVSFSPAVLGSCLTKPLFIVYQLLQVMCSLHDRGLVLGDLQLNDIMLSENLWIQVIPFLEDNIHETPQNNKDKSKLDQSDGRRKDGDLLNVVSNDARKKYNAVQECTKEVCVELEKSCHMWVSGQMSNLEYLTKLNYLAGRRIGDPTCHHVLPWVTDFFAPNGSNWRDLTKSKFRLNKGDRQLDLTYDVAVGSSQVPHHVSDVLSDITYYVYLSRRTPKPVLCKVVRSTWVPAEYPSSIARLQEWTPDECIPEFFTDPTVFKSIHEDLPDLEIPSWASSPEDFVERHREMLESPYVSERLNQWIDLTFGYKLSGTAAVKSKNVCLHLVDSHTSLSSCGVVQLFTQPHPPRVYTSVKWGKVPPRNFLPPRSVKIERESGDEDLCGSGFDEDDPAALQSSVPPKSSPLAFSRLLSRSRGSLMTPTTEDGPASNLSLRTNSSGTSNAMNPNAILLPRDFHPISALQALESLQSFLGKTFLHGVTHEATQVNESEHQQSTKYKLQIVASKRLKEMQVLGCLLVELFLASRLRALASSPEQRLQICQSALRHCGDQLPRCIRHVVSLLLQVPITHLNSPNEEVELGMNSGVRYPTVTANGLPPPSAHQLLQPLLMSMLIPFPTQFRTVYTLLKKNQEYSALFRELNLRAKCIGDQEKKEVCLLSEKLSECWVKSFAHDLVWVMAKLELPFVQLLLPHVRQLMEDTNTAVFAAWYLFDPIAQGLGPSGACTYLLDSVIKLYSDFRFDGGISNDSRENSESSCVPNHKQAKLFHRSFLLRLIIRFGLRAFLENFIAPLVEAVGGYHETCGYMGSINYSGKGVRVRRRNTPASAPFDSCELDEPSLLEGVDLASRDTSSVKMNAEGILSPMDEDLSGGEVEHQTIQRPPCFEAGNDATTNIEVEPEMFVLDADDDAAPLYQLMDQLDLHQDDADDCEESPSSHGITSLSSTNEGPKSPTIPIPGSNSEMESGSNNVMSAGAQEDVGVADDSFVNDFSFASIAQAEEERGVNGRSLKADKELKVSDVSAESLLWLAHRLGPVLSARYLSRNLLRMLTLCYLRSENLQPISNVELMSGSKELLDPLKIVKWTVVGDRNAAKVLDCLSSIAALYGEQLIVLQYLPHMGELIAHCRRKLTLNLEAGLVGCLALLRHIVPYMTDNTLMDQLQDVILKTILHPAVRLLSTTRLSYPSGWTARMTVAAKFCNALYLLSMRLGREMTHRHLAVPALQRFFLTFSKAHLDRVNALAQSSTPGSCTSGDCGTVIEAAMQRDTTSPLRSLEESSYLEIRRDGTTTEWAVRRGVPVQIMHVRNHSRMCGSESADSYSPPHAASKQHSVKDEQNEGEDIDPTRVQAQEELCAVFSPRLAHLVYIPFFRFLGESVVEQALKNHLLIQDLCFDYEQEMQHAAPNEVPVDMVYLSDYLSPPMPLDMERAGSGSFGTNVALIGNRIELQRPDLQSGGSGSTPGHMQHDEMASASLRLESNTIRHLRGNWLAYWEHEIGRAEKDSRFNFKQIKLQTFSGHTNSVRSIVALGNENSFLSASRDKTVKLWSLRSQGDGGAISHCQWNYTGHRKSIITMTFVETLRLVASCDSVVQLWDPWLGRVVSGQPGEQYAGGTGARSPPPINVLRALPAPSAAILAATTDSSLRMLDARLCLYVNQLKVSLTPVGLIRCMAVGPNGNWAAIGQSSGFLTILDIRTGLIIASWKGHEGEVLQLIAINDSTLVSSSLDQTVSVWNAVDGKLRFHLKGPTEPVHCLAAYASELISGTTANRIGVHTAIDSAASFSSTRLRSDTFRGVLTTMAVLPLNRLLLLGADNGTINLLC